MCVTPTLVGVGPSLVTLTLLRHALKRLLKKHNNNCTEYLHNYTNVLQQIAVHAFETTVGLHVDAWTSLRNYNAPILKRQSVAVVAAAAAAAVTAMAAAAAAASAAVSAAAAIAAAAAAAAFVAVTAAAAVNKRARNGMWLEPKCPQKGSKINDPNWCNIT